MGRVSVAQPRSAEELGAAVGICNRVIAHQERDGAQPPGAVRKRVDARRRTATLERARKVS